MASTSSPASQSENETTNAFEEIVSALATSSSSTSMKKLPCSVFINHRGPDVKETVAKPIYHALHAKCIRVFLDKEELLLGDNIPVSLQNEMSSASLHIAIFSPGYADSVWCLAELSFMLQTGKLIIPVFYHVKPDDLRWVVHGEGAYAEAFARHEQKRRYTEQKILEWKTALHNTSLLVGQIVSDSKEEDGEPKELNIVIRNIVNRVLEIVGVPLQMPKYVVGLQDAVANFEIFVQESENMEHQVQIVGIWDMGGVGKTTLAKQLYDKKRSDAEYSSIIFDIKEAAKEKKLYEIQRRLLKELGIPNIPYFSNIEEGKKFLLNNVKSVRVLIVLDDVDCPTQLDALLPMKYNLAQGSLILVTTRDREVLQRWSITTIYKMEPMNSFHAKQLFCWHAFKEPSPRAGFEGLVSEFTHACNGLPLSLKVVGSMLFCYSDNKDFWEDVLQKISKILLPDIKDCLRVSYDALDAEEKQIFLDAACFFVGENNMKAIAVWEGSNWSGLYGLERLISKCLLDLNENCITMHDHLRDLGREIATIQLPYRLWSPNQIAAVIQKQYQEKIPIRGMILNTGDKGGNKLPGLLLNKRRPFLGFVSSKRRSLSFAPQVFVFEGNHKHQLPIVGSSKELAWLSCTGIADRNMTLTMENLRVLDLHYCEKLVRLWRDGPGAPEQLRMLTIDGCPKLQRIPKSIGLLKNLKQISMRCSRELKGLPEEFGCLLSLEHLQLNYCDNLKSLPSSFGELVKLRHLDLSRLINLMMLPDSFKQLKSLQHLNLAGCSRLGLQPDVMENISRLEYLNLNGCRELKDLPTHIINQIGLTELYAEDICLRRLPMDIGKLSNLKVMKVGSQALAESFGGLKHLEHLDLTRLEVESLPQSFKQLSNLQTLAIRESRIGELNFWRGEYTSSLCNLQKIRLSETEVYKISISEDCCPRLKIVDVLQCGCLREVEILPKTVEEIDMEICPELIALLISPNQASLKTICLLNLQKIEKIENLQECTSLEQMTIEDCPQLKALPNFGRLVSLKKIALEGFHKIDSIDGLQQCTSLDYLSLKDCKQLSELSCFEKLASLFSVSLYGLPKIEKIEGLQNCTSLRRIRIVDCPQLSVLVCFENLDSLGEFTVEKCKKVVNLEGLRHCSGLRWLKVENTCLGLQAIESSGQMQFLEPSIPKIEKHKFPAGGLVEMLIRTRAMPDTGSVINPSDFPSLSVLQSFEKKKIPPVGSSGNGSLTLKGRGVCCSNWNAAMLYLVINCVSQNTIKLGIMEEWDWWQRVEMEDGRWILICSLSLVMSENKLCMLNYSTSSIEVDEGLLLMGDPNDIREAFLRTIARLGN